MRCPNTGAAWFTRGQWVIKCKDHAPTRATTTDRRGELGHLDRMPSLQDLGNGHSFAQTLQEHGMSAQEISRLGAREIRELRSQLRTAEAVRLSQQPATIREPAPRTRTPPSPPQPGLRTSSSAVTLPTVQPATRAQLPSCPGTIKEANE